MLNFTLNLIAGRLTPANGRTIELANPHTEVVDRSVRLSSAADTAEAVAAARAALPQWSATPVEERGRLLSALADALEARSEDLAQSIVAEVGTPPRIAAAVQVGLAITDARVYGKKATEACASETIGHSQVLNRPLGVVAAITPWNYPLHQAVAKVGAALAAGCTVVLKPSELVPGTNHLLSEIFAETFPAGVVNVIHGDAEIGSALINDKDIDAISFTGSTAAGRIIAATAGSNLVPCFLELGGKSPAVILPEADLAGALRGTLSAGWLNSGQTCTALTRVILPESLVEEARPIIAEVAAKTESRLGPLISRTQFERVQGFIARGIDSGAEVLAGGLGRPAGEDVGFRTRATVFLVNDSDHELVRDEIFGPVICIQPYSSIEQAVDLANDTPYGLAAAVWGGTSDPVDQVAARLRAGQVDVNGASFNPEAPFGGFGWSGSGRELGFHGIREFTLTTSVQNNTNSLPGK